MATTDRVDVGEDHRRRSRSWPWARVSSALRWAVLLAVAVAIIVPIVYAFLGGFRSTGALRNNPAALPDPWIISNYTEILGGDLFWNSLCNSIVIAVITVVVVVGVSALAAYVFARFAFPGRELLFTLFALGLLFPAAAAILPLYILLRSVGLLDNPLGVALPQAAFGIPLTIIILRPFFQSIPRELEDAAAIDGCSRFGFFWRVLLPLSPAGARHRGDPRARGQLERVPAAPAHPRRHRFMDPAAGGHELLARSTRRTWRASSRSPRCRWSRRSCSTCSRSASSSAA